MAITDQRQVSGQFRSDDRRLVFDQVVNRLYREFRGRCSRGLVEDLVAVCRSELACSPPDAVPELAERLARQRLQSGWASLLIENR